MNNSVQHMIAIGFLLSLFWAGVCVLQAQQSGSATVEQKLKFQPQLVKKTVSVINPPARGSVATTLKGTELAPNASGKDIQIGSNGSQREPVRVEYEICCAELRDRGDC